MKRKVKVHTCLMTVMKIPVAGPGDGELITVLPAGRKWSTMQHLKTTCCMVLEILYVHMV